MQLSENKSVLGNNAIPNNQVMVINKGSIFSELERLKSLDNHRMKLD